MWEVDRWKWKWQETFFKIFIIDFDTKFFRFWFQQTEKCWQRELVKTKQNKTNKERKTKSSEFVDLHIKFLKPTWF